MKRGYFFGITDKDVHTYLNPLINSPRYQKEGILELKKVHSGQVIICGF
jgi:hypothetical protein